MKISAAPESLPTDDKMADAHSDCLERGAPFMKSLVEKRSVVLAGHKTSVSLEDAFWKSLKEIAVLRQMSLSDLLTAIDAGRHHGNLSSAIRLFVLNFYRDQFDLRHRLDEMQATLGLPGPN
jgi:predicted DNA-binding ribbon-helix-helix protein